MTHLFCVLLIFSVLFTLTIFIYRAFVMAIFKAKSI